MFIYYTQVPASNKKMKSVGVYTAITSAIPVHPAQS